MTQHAIGTSGRGARRTTDCAIRPLLTVSLAAVVTAALAGPAYSVDNINIGQQYNDGLDTRYSVTSFTRAAQSMGSSPLVLRVGRAEEKV